MSKVSMLSAAGHPKGQPSAQAGQEAEDQALADLQALMRQACIDAGGWLPFDAFMSLALYAPGLGYYSRSGTKIGPDPAGGSDFVTAPELSPIFGRAVSRAVLDAMDQSGVCEVLELGAGTGALAEAILDAIGERVQRYAILDLSGDLMARQQSRLARFGSKVQWLRQWPQSLRAVVLGNEVLDAMPVKRLHWPGGDPAIWQERGVVWDESSAAWAWQDRPCPWRPPWAGPFAEGTCTEIHPQAEAFVRSLWDVMAQGRVLLIDYGHSEAHYYHPQRTDGTLMCHYRHLADAQPLLQVGAKDITAHVNFTGVALCAQEAGFEVLGYTTQARFLMNCGLLDDLQGASPRDLAAAQKLLNEHEMGEQFKVLLLGKGEAGQASLPSVGFQSGDRLHTL